MILSLLEVLRLAYNVHDTYGWIGVLVVLVSLPASLFLFFRAISAGEGRSWKKARRMLQKAQITASGHRRWKFLSAAFFHPLIFGSRDIMGHNEILLGLLWQEIKDYAGPNSELLLERARTTFESYRLLGHARKSRTLTEGETAEQLRTVQFIRTVLLYRGDLSRAAALADLQAANHAKQPVIS